MSKINVIQSSSCCWLFHGYGIRHRPTAIKDTLLLKLWGSCEFHFKANISSEMQFFNHLNA